MWKFTKKNFDNIWLNICAYHHSCLLTFSSNASCTTPDSRKSTKWTAPECRALVQFVATHRDLLPHNTSEWPMVCATHTYWAAAATYVQETPGCVLRKGIFREIIAPIIILLCFSKAIYI